MKDFYVCEICHSTFYKRYMNRSSDNRNCIYCDNLRAPWRKKETLTLKHSEDLRGNTITITAMKEYRPIDSTVYDQKKRMIDNVKALDLTIIPNESFFANLHTDTEDYGIHIIETCNIQYYIVARVEMMCIIHHDKAIMRPLHGLVGSKVLFMYEYGNDGPEIVDLSPTGEKLEPLTNIDSVGIVIDPKEKVNKAYIALRVP